ncbi:putative cation exchanger [Pseudozyma hubeiensis]|nr:putative cation exchanger [Pseudozyma hubeiensis]
MAGSRHRKDAWLVFALLIVVQIVCFRGSQRLRADLAPQAIDAPSRHQWHKRQEPNTFELLKHPATSSTTSASSKTYTSTSKKEHNSTASPQPTSPSKHPHGKHDASGCQPIPFDRSARHVCSHVVRHCSASGHFDYLRFYYCAGVSDDELGHDQPSEPPSNPRWQPGIAALRLSRLVIIFVWMLFLFSWVGVVASDFFCPNLSTIASRLGLNESTAGVTFLAFGNGSPDVFSTFGAMKTDSGSLAIGELLGAASFIVSVISGSMMLIAPFKVKAWPFCRDVGFFTVAVALTLAFLFDGKLRRIETIALICLYVLYAATVIVGSWWQERRRKQRRRLEAAREEFDSQADNRSIRSRGSIRSGREGMQTSEHSRLLEPPRFPSTQRPASPSEYDPDFDPFEDWANQRGDQSRASTPDISRNGSRAPSVHTPGSANSVVTRKATLNVRPNLVPRHSLLSAIEFRDVVQSLRRDAIADRSQEIFQSWDPERFLPHHHHGQTQSNLTRSTSGEGFAAGHQTQRRGVSHNRVLSLGPSISPNLGLPRSASTSTGNRRRTVGAHDGVGLSEETRSRASVNAGNVDDPWREHIPGDGCEPLTSPALPLPNTSEQDPAQEAAPRKALPRLEIPQWDTKASRSQDGRRAQHGRKQPAQSEVSSSTSTTKDRFDSLASQRRIRPARTASELFAWKVRVILNSLFPSLRHLHAKSLLGAAVSVATSPAILLLNLTLPVVDDEAEQAEREADAAEADGIGAVRLEGEEAELRAEAAGSFDQEPVEGLRASSSSDVQAWGAEERVEAMEDAERDVNTHRDQEIASALRQLPSMAGSPLSFGSGPTVGAGMLRLPSSDSPLPMGAQAGTDAASSTSHEGCEAEEQEMRRSMRRFLILCQSVCAPTFVMWAIVSSSGAPHLWLKVAAGAAVGATTALLSFWAMRRKDAGRARYSDRTLSTFAMLRCSMGFVVSVMWIMTIVDEVVSILQTVGIIVGLSDAILGLTVFAVGNSLGDLVANITIARLGHPVMAISACFAGPMLNLLLGIGISGTWLLSDGHGHWSHTGSTDIYPIDFNPTLLVSGLGLLLILVGTLIAVPMNNFELTRPIGVSLIAAYVLIMTVNLLTEIFWVRGHSVL